MLLEQFLESTASRTPEKVALVCDGRRITYREVEQAANRCAAGLIERGVLRGDRVVIFLDNTVEAAIAIWGVLKAGAVIVMANPTTKADKLTYLLNNCRATAIVVNARRLAGYENCWSETPHLKTLIAVGDPGLITDCAHDVIGWDEIVSAESSVNAPPAKKCIDVDQAALIYTSGSTGNPKGVILTHQSMVSVSRSIIQYLGCHSEDIVLSVLPLSYGYGLYQWLMCCCYGGTLVLEKSLAYPHAILAKMVNEKATGFPMVPTIAAMLLQLNLEQYDLSHLRYITNAGAALPVEYVNRVRRLLPDVDLYLMYGLTECTRVCYLPPSEVDRRPDSVGHAIPNCETLIVDESGQCLGPNQVGELVVRGANVMKGYWEAPEETSRRLKPGPIPNEMWLHTGDLFRTDDEGFLYWVGRKDDMIKSRGEKVSPREVEEVLLQHPLIAEAAVVGISDPILGQVVRAVLRLNNGATLSTREVQSHCRQFLEDFMVPQQVDIRDALPRTPNGKIDRVQLTMT